MAKKVKEIIEDIPNSQAQSEGGDGSGREDQDIEGEGR